MADIEIEFVYALPGEQQLISIRVAEGASVDDVLNSSDVADILSEHDTLDYEVGIWGRVVERQRRIRAGDRLEIYRPLKMDPREARRRHAAAGLTMRDEYGD